VCEWKKKNLSILNIYQTMGPWWQWQRWRWQRWTTHSTVLCQGKGSADVWQACCRSLWVKLQLRKLQSYDWLSPTVTVPSGRSQIHLTEDNSDSSATGMKRTFFQSNAGPSTKSKLIYLHITIPFYLHLHTTIWYILKTTKFYYYLNS